MVDAPAWAPVELGVDQKRTRELPTPSLLLSGLPEADTWSAQSRKTLGRLLAYFLVCEDPQRRLDAREVSTLAHQVSLVRHILENDNLRRVLVADEVGLGKTVEVGLLLKVLLGQQPGLRILYLAPARLVNNVRREFDRLDLSFRQWSVGEADARLSDPRVIASIHRAVHESHRPAFLAAVPWEILIVDECHHLSDWAPGGGDARENFRLVRDLISRMSASGRVVLLSGTPHQGHVNRFENLLNLLRTHTETPDDLNGRVIYRTKEDVVDWQDQPVFPGRQVNDPLVFEVGPRYRAWIRHIHDYYRPVAGSQGSDARRRAAGWRCAQALQWAASSPHAGLGYLVRQALRAGWDMSVPILPDAIAALRPYRTGTIDEPVDQLFQRIRREIDQQAATGEVEDIEDETGGSDPASRRELQSLIAEGLEIVRQEPDGKWQFIWERLLTTAGDEKVVLFAQPIETVTALATFLTRSTGTRPALIVGGQSDQDRQVQIELFSTPSGPRFLVSSRAGGEGINLQVARRLVHVDVPWNPMELEQRVGRIHRFGSRRTILVDTVVVRDSREADAYRVARERLRLIASTLVQSERFEGMFSRVMALVPPEELQNVLINQALAPLSGGDQETIARIVQQGFSRWRDFHDRFAESQRQIQQLNPGLATWDDVRRGLEKYAAARTANGYTVQRFHASAGQIEPTAETASVLTLDSIDYLCADTGGAPVWGPNGQSPAVIGLNKPPASALLHRLAFPEGAIGAAHVRWPDGAVRPSSAPKDVFGALIFSRQSVQTRGLAAWEERDNVLCVYVVTEQGGATVLAGEDSAPLIRGLLEATVRLRPEASARLIGIMQQEEIRLVDELRRPDPTELENGIRWVVVPLVAAIVS